MRRIGFVIVGLLVGVLAMGFFAAVVTSGYEARAVAAEQQVSYLTARLDVKDLLDAARDSRLDADEDNFVVLDKLLTKLVDPKTGKLLYGAMDPQFLKGYWEDHGQILALRGALGGRGYGPDGKLVPVEFYADQAFAAKVHSAKFLLQSGRTEAARALFLSALAERSIEIGACHGPVPPKEFSPWYEAPVELLPLLAGSPYSAEVIRAPEDRSWEDKVLIGVGENFIKGC